MFVVYLEIYLINVELKPIKVMEKLFKEIGHTERFCRRKSLPMNKKGSNEKGKEKVNEIKKGFTKQWIRKRD